jgi:hypothetical protein
VAVIDERQIRIAETNDTNSMVVLLDPSTNWPLMYRPVGKEVFPVNKGVFHSCEKVVGIGRVWSDQGWSCPVLYECRKQ